ncbi:Uncharacterized membrane protein [Acinetobacter marinus]|uniref:Uncharacterized membrane protein n=1 Tax=Acinetobacter marinus TaxID=281375 RepID=A0A1G6H047_9GAMM|nr:DUF2339 domain-containing protein [Acinetobacter marinus]SDB87518.1 Uncharacterized membrane protein [Acinetobacter marinus]
MTHPSLPNNANKNNNALHTSQATTSLFRFPDATWARILLIIFAILFLGELVFGGQVDILWWLALLGSVIIACNTYENQNAQIKQLQQSTFQLQQQVDRLSQSQIQVSNSATQVDAQRDASIEENKEIVAESNRFPKQVSPSYQNEIIQENHGLKSRDLKIQDLENISTDSSATASPAWMNANTTQSTKDLQSDHFSKQSEKIPSSNSVKQDSPQHDELKTMTSMWDAALNWFKGGNSIVRIAVVILLIGVVLLLRFASEYWQLTLSAKMAGIGASGIALTGLGYFLRQRRFDYAISLQGLGLGVLFLVLFSSFHLGVIQSVTLSYVALIAILATTLWLAIRQNALILAFIALGSGFIAPFILNTGSNNIPALMAYFFVLNLALAIIAYFKPWRILNTLALLITFGLGGFAIWTKAEDAQAFQIACWVWAIFAIYLFISIRYSQHIVALKTQFKDIPYIDTSLIFATPFMAFSLYAGLVSSDGYALSIASAVLASVYLVLAYVLHQKAKQLLILTQCFYGLGFVFLALILPFAFDAYWSSVGWAIHGLVMLWLGWRYAIVNARYFGVALLLASGVATLYVVLFNNQSALFAGCLLMASYAIATYLLLHPKAETETSNATALASICGMTLLLLSLILAPVNYFYAMDKFYGLNSEWISLPLLFWTFVLYLGYSFFAKSQTHLLLKISGFIVLAITAFETLIGNVGYQLEGKSYLAMTYHGGYEWYALMGSAVLWLIIFAILVRDTVFKNQRIALEQSSNSHFLNAIVQVYTAVAVLMLAILGSGFANENSYVPMLAVLPIIAFVLTYFVKRLHHWQSLWVANLAVIVVVWYWLVMVSFGQDGAWSFPFVPLLNPIDLVSIAGFFFLTLALKPFLLSVSRVWQFASASVLLGTGMLLISSVLLRVLTHYADLPYWLDGAWQNGTVQASLTILWTLIALILTTLASRQSWRYIWMLGIAVLGLVIFKLIFHDLSQSQTLTRIISFIGSGLIMLVIGYFSPLPPTNKRLGE